VCYNERQDNTIQYSTIKSNIITSHITHLITHITHNTQDNTIQYSIIKSHTTHLIAHITQHTK
jgi:hypothetical protein